MQLAEVSRDTLRMNTVYTGSLRARRSVRVFTQEEGTITDLPFFEGDQVKAGDILLKLDDQLLRAELAKASARRAEGSRGAGE